MPSWINDRSNFVMVGDSCHAMLPYLAQGANSALEDGAVLGLLLGRMQSKAQLPQALRLYERLRKERGEAIVKETFKQVSPMFFLSCVARGKNNSEADTPFSASHSICPMGPNRKLGIKYFSLSLERK